MSQLGTGTVLYCCPCRFVSANQRNEEQPELGRHVRFCLAGLKMDKFTMQRLVGSTCRLDFSHHHLQGIRWEAVRVFAERFSTTF